MLTEDEQKAPLKRGDYVLVTKYSDGDPGDDWGLGYLDRVEFLHPAGRIFATYKNDDGREKQLRANGFRAVARVSPEMGRWLLENAKILEAAPNVIEGQGISLWGMLGIIPLTAHEVAEQLRAAS